MAGAMLIERAQAVSMTNRSEGINLLNEIVSDPSIGISDDDEDNIRVKEQGILHLGELYKKEGKAKELAELIKATRPFLSLISKAKAAKLVRSLVDFFLDLEAGIGIEVLVSISLFCLEATADTEMKKLGLIHHSKFNPLIAHDFFKLLTNIFVYDMLEILRVQLCKECIDWAKEERRTFLRQSLEARLIALYFDTGMFSEALQLGSALLKELKKLDDKQLLVEVQLLESKTYHALSNLAKARAALTSARTTANAIYCPPKMQAALDLQSGILHAADERDFKTAYSYFYEAFEGYDSVECPKALTALKYMLLSKIMLRTPEDVQSIMSGKLAVKYAGRDLDAMRAVAEASHRRSLADFQAAVKKYRQELEDDVIVRAHLGSLYDAMLEQNLCRLVEPYSRVQVSHIASCISLPLAQVEKKLSQMILDKKLRGVLDQGEGVLIVFEDTPRDKTYEIALDTIHSMGKVVDTLYQKAKKLT